MSRPAQRYIRQRTVECPTCGAHRGRPCQVWTPAEVRRALDTNVWTVRPHAARKALEAAQ